MSILAQRKAKSIARERKKYFQQEKKKKYPQ
jgi:hypothetical protein